MTREIAKIRGIPTGKASISPNRHPEIDNVEELLDFIARVRSVSKLPTGFKTVMGAYGWVDDLCDAIERRGIEAAPILSPLMAATAAQEPRPCHLWIMWACR